MIGFVIVSHGCFDNAVRQASTIVAAGHRVVIVDNRSVSSSSPGVTQCDGIDVVRPTANAGFGVGANIGLIHLGPLLGDDDRVFVMNDDLELGAGWEGPELCGVAASTDRMVFFDVLREEGYSRSLRPTLVTAFLWPFAGRLARSTRFRRFSHPAGACVATSLRNWQLLGGFDPHHFLYFEDTDLWHRAESTCGVRSIDVPASAVWHLGARSTSARLDLSGREYGRGLGRYLTRHAGRRGRVIMVPITLSTLIVALRQRLGGHDVWRRNWAAAVEQLRWMIGRPSPDTPYLEGGAMPLAERERVSRPGR